MGKSPEKLSTGLRVNRASDDAAGLSVSESLRRKIRGMGRAKSNAEDGIALVQIAEDITGEINNILKRMRELDFAKETTEFTRAQILSQSATAVLAQANQVSQGELSLLK